MVALFFGALLNGINGGGKTSGPAVEDPSAAVHGENCQITPPGKPWRRDEALQAAMGVSAAYRRKEPSSAMAFLNRDYRTRQPRPAELIDEALHKLRGYMPDVEYEIKKDEPAMLGGQSTVRLEFRGQDPEQVPSVGECLMMAYRGCGYWFFTWAPKDDAAGLEDEWTGLRKGFTLSSQREGWSEKPPKTLTAQGDKLPYKIDYIEGVWEKQERDGYDPRADVVLLGYDPKDKDARIGDKAATVQVLVLDKAESLADAVKKGKEALLEIEKGKDPNGDGFLFPGAVLDAAADSGLADVDNDVKIGAFPGHLSKFEAKLSADQSKYAVLAVVRMDEAVLAVTGECAWERRDYWDQEFTALLAKLRPKGK